MNQESIHIVLSKTFASVSDKQSVSLIVMTIIVYITNKFILLSFN